MKTSLFILALIISFSAISQGTSPPIMNVTQRLTIPADTLAGAPANSIAFKNGKFYKKLTAWQEIADSSLLATRHYLDSIASLKLNRNDSNVSKGYVTPTYADARYVKIQTQPPTAGVTLASGSTTMEYAGTANGTDTTFTDTYSYGRQAGNATTDPTANIASVVFDGVSQTVVNPAIGGTSSGSKTVIVTKNVNKVVTNTVTTAESPAKSGSASATHSWLPRRYWGFVNDTTNLRSGAGGIDAIITSLSSELSSARDKGASPIWSTGNPSGNQFFVYAYWSAAGSLTRFDFNGVPALESTDNVSRDLTNARGFTGQWRIYWTKNLQSTSSTLIAQ